MEVVRDLIRDLVGVIFPGGLLVIFTLWFFTGVLILFAPPSAFNVLSIGESSVGFFILLIFSYVAGQSLRIKQLNSLETECTAVYREKRDPALNQEKFIESIKEIDEEEERYFAGKSSRERLVEVYKQHNDRFGGWEEFPYPYLLKGRRLLRHPADYNEFFETFDKQNLTKYKRFFNLCKSIVFEYSPSLKEEMLRQEALVRLFAGIFYVMKYGRIINIVLVVLHVAAIISSYRFKIGFISYANLEFSYGIIFISVFACVLFRYLKKEILNQLRYMRAKELNLAFDGFYIISKKNKLDFS